VKAIGYSGLDGRGGAFKMTVRQGKNMLFLHSEATSGGDEPNDKPACTRPITTVAIVDIKDLAKPYLASLFPTPVPPNGAPYSDFCDKGGRFGPHNTNLEYHLPDVQKQAISFISLISTPGCASTTSRIRACRKKSDGLFRPRRPSVTARFPTTSS
jgi:hypothetical protein